MPNPKCTLLNLLLSFFIFLEPIDVIGTKIVNVANESNVNKYKMAHSLAKYDSLQLHLTHPASVNISIDQFELGHTRNSSNLSQQSKVSVGYGSLPSHSRQSSTESEMIRYFITQIF